MLRNKFTIKAIKVLIPVTTFLIPAYLIKISIFGVPTNVLEILVLVTFISALLDRQKFSYKEFYMQNRAYLAGVILIFAGLIISTLINGEYQTGLGIIKGWFIVPLVFFWALIEEIKKAEELQNILKWLYLSILGVSIISLVYYLQGKLTYDGRLAAFYASPNYLAMYLAPALIIGIYFFKSQISNLKSQNQSLKPKAYFFSLVISLAVILIIFYLTYSYTAWLAVIAGLIITDLIKNKKINKRIILAGSIILLLIIISQWNTEKFNNLKIYSRSSLESRMMIWKSSEKILSDNPIFGIGPGNFQNKYLEYQKYFPPYLEWAVPQPHSLYLAFWLQAGLLGFGGFIFIVVKWLMELMALVKKQKGSLSFVAAVLFGIMAYILIHGLADTLYWKNDLAMVFWVIFFLGLAVKRLDIDSI